MNKVETDKVGMNKVGMNKEQYLRDLYYSSESPVAFSSINKIWKEVKTSGKGIKYKELKEFLETLPTYQLHKPATDKFLFRKTMVSYVDQQWQADLVDMQKLQSDNKGYRFILTVIDIFSRFAWAIPIKTKRGIEIKEAFEIIFKSSLPGKIQFDEGKEFYNRDLKELLTEKNIEWFSTYSHRKAAVVERFNRTLQTRMYKYFTAKETNVWYDILENLVSGYNNTFHSSIGMKPTDARKEVNEEIVWFNLYGAHLANTFDPPKFKVGDSVRISKYKTIFAKGYLPNFTEEVFKIKQIIFTKPIVYKLEDYQNEPLEGYFYTQELSYVPNPEQLEYKIEKVLRYKTIKGKKYGLVKWKGYGDKFNDWLPLSDIKPIV